MTINQQYVRPILLTLALSALLPVLQGCFTAVATGVVVGALVVADRRTVGTQTQDTEIELKASNRVNEKYPDGIHVNFTSYNNKVLISGEVPDEAIRQDIQRIVEGVQNVHGLYNELAIGPNSSLSSRSTDTYITSKIKARQIDAKEFSANHVKVVTEARVVYLMGLLTQKEAQAAIQVARTTSDVKKVVSLIEIISSETAQQIDSTAQAQQSSTPAQTTP